MYALISEIKDGYDKDGYYISEIIDGYKLNSDQGILFFNIPDMIIKKDLEIKINTILRDFKQTEENSEKLIRFQNLKSNLRQLNSILFPNETIDGYYFVNRVIINTNNNQEEG